MLEFYQAYSDYRDLMDLTEELFAALALQGLRLDRGDLRRAPAGFRQMAAALHARGHRAVLAGGRRAAPTPAELAQPGGPRAAAERYNAWVAARCTSPEAGA